MRVATTTPDRVPTKISPPAVATNSPESNPVAFKTKPQDNGGDVAFNELRRFFKRGQVERKAAANPDNSTQPGFAESSGSVPLGGAGRLPMPPGVGGGKGFALKGKNFGQSLPGGAGGFSIDRAAKHSFRLPGPYP